MPTHGWLQALVSNVQDAIVLLDDSGRVTFESPSATELLGVRPDPVLTGFGLDRVHPDEREEVVRSFERTIAEPGSVSRATYRFQRGDGGWRHLEAIAKNLLDDPDLCCILITFRDVSERIAALESARKASEVRDELLSRVGHELRTPLHAILGWSQLMGASGDAATVEAAEQIEGAGRHLLRLVEDAMDLTAIQEGRISLEPRSVRVDDSAREAIELVRPLADAKGIGIGVRPSAGNPVAWADQGRLRQVLINLIGNAVKFTPAGGFVEIGWVVGESAIRIIVTDNGPGIPPGELDRLFERYYRLGTSRDAPGTGLGLAISRRLVEAMRGSIGVESRSGVGASFWLELPLAEKAEGSSNHLPLVPSPF